MKKVLMISYFSPPMNVPGAVRVGKFAKYLGQFGWQPIIVTCKNSHYDQDDSLYPENLEIISTKTIDIFSLMRLFKRKDNKTLTLNMSKKYEKLIEKFKLIIPLDDKIGWLPFAYKRSAKIITRQKIDMIFVSLGGVYHNAITGFLLSRKYKIPLILDFRDIWAGNTLDRKSKINEKIADYFEKKTMHQAAWNLVTAPGALQHYQNKYNLEKISLLTNGFDSEDFQDIKTLNHKEEMIITFSGSLYSSMNQEDLYQSLVNSSISGLKIILRFIGNFKSRFRQINDKYSSQLSYKNVEIEIIERLPYHEMLKYLISSDLLVLFLPAEEKVKRIYHAKIFDYIACRKPIIAFTPRYSDIDRLIQENNLGFSIEAGNYLEGKKVMEKIMKLHRDNKLDKIHGTDDFINQFDRKVLTQKLAEIFNSII